MTSHDIYLQVRLIVSLTTLLVLYTFFNQTSSSLPKTAYVKMIDVWFFSCTILLFVIIVVHVLVECLETDSLIHVSPMSASGKHQLVPLTAEALLRLFRLAVVPLVVLVFGCAYWATMFY